MRVGIDGYYLLKPRGMGRYVQELLYSLGRFAAPDCEFLVVVPRSVPSSQYVFPERIRYMVAHDAPFPIWEQFILPREMARLSLEIAHFPYNTRPLLFSACGTNCVVTIHDLIYLDETQGKGGSWYQNLGNRYRKAVVSRYAARKQFIVTDSRNSARDIQNLLGLTSEVVYIPTEYSIREFSEPNKPPAPSISSDYFLHVGGTSPHKNTERCIQAFLSVRPDNTLLVVLGLGSDSSLALKYGSDHVLFPGWVSERDMAGYYYHARAVLFPSLTEGYGLPIVEAFNFGIPVITSDIDPMREIAGGAALLVDPYSIESIGNAIYQIQQDISLRENLKHDAATRLLEINGKAMADKMLAIYTAAAS